MQQILDIDPVTLRYVAALRGVVPTAIGESFRYARYGAVDIAAALCLAASNPEGRFQFILSDADKVVEAQARAQIVRSKNCSFVTMDDAAAQEPVDFFCADLGALYDGVALARVQAMALARVVAGGQFVCRYAPFPAQMDGLHFMVAEFAPELQPEQQMEFLQELKLLGQNYLKVHPATAAALDLALAQQKPQEFFQRYGQGQASSSAAIAMIAALMPAQFNFVGDASVQSNYLEMMVPASTQDALYNLRTHLLYEVIKDYATGRLVRTDVWVKEPARYSNDSAQLFGLFYFGLMDVTQPVPDLITEHGQTLDVSSDLFQKLLELMQLMPLTIGDFLAHPDCQNFIPSDVVMAVHMLVAFGVVAPMRNSFSGVGQVDYHYPRLAGAFNQQLRVDDVENDRVMLASPVAGRPVQLKLSAALVLQAVGRVGLAESADALMPELARVAQSPRMAAQVFPIGTMPEADFAEQMIKSICQDQMIGWYALGVLDAA